MENIERYRVYDIDWDTEDEDCAEGCQPEGLADEIVVSVDVGEGLDEDALAEILSEHITDLSGFCHKGFNYEKLPEKADVSA